MRGGEAICAHVTLHTLIRHAKPRHLNEHVFERRVGYTPVTDADAFACGFHFGEDLLRRDAADGDAAAKSVADQRVGHGACS